MHHQKGFTIIELLIIIVVIGIIATITVAGYTGVQTRTRDTERTTEVKSVQKAIETYREENDMYPSAGSDNAGYNLTALQSALVPKYINSLPTDPKAGSSYQYVRGAIANDSYAVRVMYEGQPQCKRGVNSSTTGWWGIPDCP